MGEDQKLSLSFQNLPPNPHTDPHRKSGRNVDVDVDDDVNVDVVGDVDVDVADDVDVDVDVIICS